MGDGSLLLIFTHSHIFSCPMAKGLAQGVVLFTQQKAIHPSIPAAAAASCSLVWLRPYCPRGQLGKTLIPLAIAGFAES
jgi:hypothetical protein